VLRIAILLSLLAAAPAASAQSFRLPFDAQWFVLQGGDTPNVNDHMAVRAQWFGVDFAKVGGQGNREVARPNYSRLEDFYSWGEPVLAPHQGTVTEVVKDLPDNPLGVKDALNPLGNHVVIEAAPGQFVFLAHFQRGSIVVRRGEQVTPGQLLGRCGNSGNSDFPHIHMHVQDRPDFGAGTGQNPVFRNMRVEMNGKTFDNVTWPLMRGFFVSPH
jgi:murein DD-endopeptidase MepM/ murein hydrolase activator NlpD